MKPLIAGLQFVCFSIFICTPRIVEPTGIEKPKFVAYRCCVPKVTGPVNPVVPALALARLSSDAASAPVFVQAQLPGLPLLTLVPVAAPLAPVVEIPVPP